jgi:hypothetical protein
MLMRINERLCQECGKPTRNPVMCSKCFRDSPAGKVLEHQKYMMRKYTPVEGGGSCRACVHWEYRCTLGFPEGGTMMADLCPAREAISVLE